MVLSRVLYPDFTSEIRGEDHIKDTDRPVAEKSLNGETTRSLEYLSAKTAISSTYRFLNSALSSCKSSC
jgi:hypothetical protein